MSSPPSHMIGDDRHSVSALRLDAWVRGNRNNGLFVRPRLFMPYYEECKVSVVGTSYFCFCCFLLFLTYINCLLSLI